MLQEFVQQIKDTVNECIEDIHTALPAKIVSIEDGMATVLPSAKKMLADGSLVDYPQISGVPVVFPQGAGQTAVISFPANAGDSCLLVISEQSLEDWLYGRETDTTLMFDMSNAICIPGLFQKVPDSFAEACSDKAVIIEAGGNRLKVAPGGISVTGTLTVYGDLNVGGSLNY